jgi:hypothetical protein
MIFWEPFGLRGAFAARRETLRRRKKERNSWFELSIYPRAGNRLLNSSTYLKDTPRLTSTRVSSVLFLSKMSLPRDLQLSKSYMVK